MATQFASIVNNKNYSGNLTYIGSYDLLSQDPIANTSSIRLYGSVYNSNSYASYGSDWGTFKLDGTTIYDDSYRFYYGTTSLGTKDITVTHNADGSFPSRSVALYADSYHFNGQSTTGTISGISAIDRNGASVTLSTSNITASGFTVSATTNQNCNKWEYRVGTSGSWTTFSTTDGKSASVAITGLNPAVSYTVYVRVTRTYNNVQSTSSVSATTLGYATIDSIANINTGSSAVVKFTPKATVFYYKVDFKLNGTTLTTETIGNVAQTSQYSYTTSYKFPVTLLPNSTSATITATLYTYTNSSYNVLVGTGQTKTFTLTVPSSVVPSFGNNFSVTPYSTNAWLSNKSFYVSGYSQIKIVAPVSAGTGAQVSSVTVTGQSIYSSSSSSNTYTFYTNILTGSGSKSFTTTVTDSRGRTASRTDSVTYLAYSAPAVNAMSAQRGTYSDGIWTPDENGNHIRITASAAGSLSSQGNTLTLRLTAKIDGIDTPPTAQSGNYYYWTGTTADQSYVVTAEVTDLVGTTSTSFITVSSVSVPFNLNTLMPAAAFGKVAEIAKALELASDWRLMANGKQNIFNYLPYSWVTTGNGTYGWLRIATISILDTYYDAPIEFLVQRRRDGKSVKLSVMFATGNTSDPALSSFYYDDISGTRSINRFQAFMYKTAASTWDVYVQESGTYDSISVSVLAPYYAQRWGNISYQYDQVTSVPNEAVMATQLPIVNTARYNRFDYLPYSFNTGYMAGTAGYLRIATITNYTGGTANTEPFHFRVMRTFDSAPVDLYLRLAFSSTSHDVAIESLHYEAHGGLYNNNFSAFAVKVGTGVYDVYVQKPTSGSIIDVWTYVSQFTQDKCAITYSEAIAPSVPSGAVMATPVPALVNGRTFTRSSGSATIDTIALQRQGALCIATFRAVNGNSQLAVGSNGWIGTTNLPKPSYPVSGVAYSGQTCLVAYLNNNAELTIRVTGDPWIANYDSSRFGLVYFTNENLP